MSTLENKVDTRTKELSSDSTAAAEPHWEGIVSLPLIVGVLLQESLTCCVVTALAGTGLVHMRCCCCSYIVFCATGPAAE